ncbi:MAG TPA: hypothetical protein VM733_03735 [Thermoanaerobaculia bacterium]|nr:hypothetical protein [Thermoanaerobaculia bacterium]
MPFPEHIDRVLSAYRVPADTKAALYDLYLSLGDEVLDVFADLADGVTSATMLRPDDTLTIREQVVERYLRRSHPLWSEGKPTASLWHPRVAEGRASGAAIPMARIDEGIPILGRNAHLGGRADTISFDVVAFDLEDAVLLAKAEGQQHTIPGSAGETSGTFDSASNVALIWEVQPNVFKPSGDRNRAIAKIYRKHRNWHVLTLRLALEWLRAQKSQTFLLRGDALAVTHEVNPRNPMSDAIPALHDRTVEEVVRALGATLEEPTDQDELMLLDSGVMNHALRKHVLVNGARGAVRKIAAW